MSLALLIPGTSPEDESFTGCNVRDQQKENQTELPLVLEVDSLLSPFPAYFVTLAVHFLEGKKKERNEMSLLQHLGDIETSCL